MHNLDNFEKISKFNLKNYFLNLQFCCGDPGYYDISIPYYDYLYISQNIRGLPIKIPISDNKIDEFSFNTSFHQNIFYYQLEYDIKEKGIEEIKEREPFIHLTKEIFFPKYYYTKIKGNNYINMDINIRIKIYVESEINNNYIIKGYIVDENIIKRKINGEYVELKDEDSFKGNYITTLGFGFIQINHTIDNIKNDKYILIEINNKEKPHIETVSYSILEISVKEYNKNRIYFLHTNTYILETLDKNSTKRNFNDYIIVNHKGLKVKLWLK